MLLSRAEIVMALLVICGALILRKYIPNLITYHDASGHGYDPIFLDVLSNATHITTDPGKADIVLPSESVLDPKRNQVLMHVSNEDVMMDRNAVWKLFVKKGGRDYASEYIPEVFLVCNSSASDDYELFLQKKTEWPSTMFRPFLLRSESKTDTEGEYMTQSDIEDCLREIKNNNLLTRIFSVRLNEKSLFALQYTVIQKVVLNPYICKSRCFKLELYMAFTNRDGKTKAHLFRDGLVYWARTRWNATNKTIHNTVASRRMMRKGRTVRYYERIYAKYPQTLQQLMTCVGSNESHKIFTDVLRVLKELCVNCSTEIGNEFGKNDTMNLYSVEVTVDENARAWLMLIDKPGKLSDPTRAETEIRAAAWEDLMKINNLILNTTENRFKTIFEQ